MDEAESELPAFEVQDRELRQMMGMFDAPAFARRGQELESFLVRLQARCQRERHVLLDMVRLRLRQWASVSRADDWRSVFATPIDPLWSLSGADPPRWAETSASLFRRRVVGRDLVASVTRFGRRWTGFLESIQLDSYNKLVHQYNRYYLLEKEMVLGSSRLAARHFRPKSPLTIEHLLEQFPPLPVPELIR
jgi:hypothetical protein